MSSQRAKVGGAAWSAEKELQGRDRLISDQGGSVRAPLGSEWLRGPPTQIASNKFCCKGVTASHTSGGATGWRLKGKAGACLSCGLDARSKLTDGQPVLAAVPVIPRPIRVHLHTGFFAPTPGLPRVPVGVVCRRPVQEVEGSGGGALGQAQVGVSVVLLRDARNGLILFGAPRDRNAAAGSATQLSNGIKIARLPIGGEELLSHYQHGTLQIEDSS